MWATLKPRVHHRPRRYTKLFPLLLPHISPPRTPNHQFTVRCSQHTKADGPGIERRREIPHRRTSLNIHRTTGYYCGPSCHPQTLNTVPHCAASQISKKCSEAEDPLKKAKSNYTKGCSAYLCRRHITPDRLQLVTIAHLPPRAHIHQCAIRQNQQSGAKRVRITRKEGTTHLQVLLVAHGSDPCQLATPCRPKVVNTTLLIVTLKSYEKGGVRSRAEGGKRV